MKCSYCKCEYKEHEEAYEGAENFCLRCYLKCVDIMEDTKLLDEIEL